jgi:hypothetical protein
MIVASIALLAGVSAISAQEQEPKLIDRLLKPNMSLANSAQNKQFRARDISVPKRAAAKRYYTPGPSRAKLLAVKPAFSARQFATGRFQAGDATASTSSRSQLTKTEMVYVASTAYGTRVAPENGSNLATEPFAGNQPFLGRGKSQKALSARDTPLTIEQVRELLNKNK